MGGLLNRSLVHGDIRGKKEKRKHRHQQLDVPFEPDTYPIHERNENEDSNMDFINKYKVWPNKFGSQQMMNMNDPPGAPSTYSSNYSMSQDDILTQPWPNSLHSNNSFYPINSLPMTSTYNVSFIPNQFNQTQISETINNQSKTIIPEERSARKVKFSSSSSNQQPKQTSTFKSLTNTQSWQESTDTSVPTRKVMPLSNQSSLPRTLTVTPKTSSVEKPIYVGVDFRATLAERDQTNDNNKRHRKTGEKSPSDGLNSSSNHRKIHLHEHKHQTRTDSPRSNIESIPNKSFDNERLIIKSSLNNRLNQNNEQISEIKPAKSRNNRRQQSSTTNEIKSSKTRQPNRHHHHHQEQQLRPLSNDSSSTRRFDIKQSNAPVMRISLSQFNHQHHRQPIVLSTATKMTKVNRTRIQT